MPYPRPRLYYLDQSSRTPQPACRFIDGQWKAREIPTTADFFRIIESTDVGRVRVYLVFWGHDQQEDDDGPPLLFMVRGMSARGPIGAAVATATLDEAEAAHARFVVIAREALGLARLLA